MRIALLSVSDQLGGSEVVLLELIHQLRTLRPGWGIDMITPGGGPLATRGGAAGATVHVVPMPPGVAQLGEWAGVAQLARKAAIALRALPEYQRRIDDVLREIAPDVIHSNGFKAHVVSARSPVRARRLWHLHEYISTRPLTRRLLRRYATACDLCVANSRSVAADVDETLRGRLRRPPVVIWNGVDTARFRASGPALDLDALSGLPPADTVRVGLVATFSRWKGHDVFLRAMASLSPDRAVRGYVVGAPVYDTRGSQYSMEELRAMAGALGCDQNVGFPGFQADAAAVMRSLDIVVHASLGPEPFGLVLVEAMAAGRPVVSSGLGGAAEIVEDGVNALVHEAGNAASLAAAIDRLAGDPLLRQRLAAGGRATVEARFDAANFGRAFATAYAGLIQTNDTCSN